MKKFTIILFLSLIVSIVASAQVRNVAQINVPADYSFASYVGVAADTLSSNQDSIQIPFLFKLHKSSKLSVGVNLAKRSANDTLVHVRVYGKNFSGDAYTLLLDSTSANVNSSALQFTIPANVVYNYRYFRVNLSIAGTKSTGVKVNRVELKHYLQ